jgi:hypothetical protein
VSFAGPLKQGAAAAFGIIVSEYAAAVLWEPWKNNPNARVQLVIDGIVEADISVREYLQYFGTEAHRDIPMFGKGVWTAGLMNMLDPGRKYVVSDARFENECAAIREAGGKIVLVDRGLVSGDGHASETLPPDELIDMVLYNKGRIADLYIAIDAWMLIERTREGSGNVDGYDEGLPA